VGRGTKRFVQVVERLNEASGILAQAGLFALFLIVCWEVLTRYLLRDPSVFSAEVSEYLMVLLTFASAGLIMKDGRHVRVEVVVARLGRRGRALAGIFSQGVVLLICAILMVEGTKSTYLAFISNYRSTSLLNFPLWIPYSLVPLGALLLGLQSVAMVIKEMAELGCRRS